MTFRALVLAVAALAAFAPAAAAGASSEFALPGAGADERSDSKAQVEFGIKLAQNELWKEATYRWERATQIDPTYAEAWNNLAIGYEHQGRFEEADAAYQRALKLAPKNAMIRQNYDLFKEIYERTTRRRDR